MATLNILPKANYKTLVGVVVNAGERARTVRVRLPNQTWNKRVHKFFNDPKYVLVHDPRRSCETGDVVSIRSGWRVSKHVKHTVTGIVSPFGRTIEERPPVMTEEERVQERLERRKAKDARQAARGRETSITRLKQTKKQEETEASQEERALARLDNQSLKPLSSEQIAARVPRIDMSEAQNLAELYAKAEKIILKETDFEIIKQKIQDVITVRLEAGNEWALRDDRLDVLTLWVAAHHAKSKQRVVGKELPLLAGKSPKSHVIHEQLYIAEVMRRLGGKYHDNFWLIASEQSKTSARTVLRAIAALKKRITRQWREHIFETREADVMKARQERRTDGKVTNRVANLGATDWASKMQQFTETENHHLDIMDDEALFLRAADSKQASQASLESVEAVGVTADDVPIQLLDTLSVNEQNPAPT